MSTKTEPMESSKQIASFLTDLCCCSRCIFRFLGVFTAESEAYKNPNLLDFSVNNEDTESNPKKLKPNTCPVCLDCYEPTTVEKIIENFSSLGIDDYQYPNFFFNVSFPKCLPIRAHSMLLHLKKHFPNTNFGGLYEENPIEQPHKIFRAVASDLLAKNLQKSYHPKSHLSLLISISYENDNLEIYPLKSMVSKKKKLELSRNNIPEILKNLEDDKFTKHFPVPPKIPNKGVLLEKVDVMAEPLYLGGRYLKFSRNLGQTPWIIDGVNVTDHNVQDVIFNAVVAVLGCKKKEMTFTASGREDVDVRTLGTGRPFYIKIDNPRQRTFTEQQFSQIEKLIVDSNLCAVVKLQPIYASDINRIKHGEETKKKTYRALCKLLCPGNIQSVVEKINSQPEDLPLNQLTVMRVLHRRTLMSRVKIIHKMLASPVAGHDNLFEVEMVTQAGTYVKEFIHGDFKRTTPNISSIVGCETDLVALDCVDIDLVWPESENKEI